MSNRPPAKLSKTLLLRSILIVALMAISYGLERLLETSVLPVDTGLIQRFVPVVNNKTQHLKEGDVGFFAE